MRVTGDLVVRPLVPAVFIGFVVAAGVLLNPDEARGQGAVLHKTGPIQITADGSTVWVANPDHHSVSRLDTVDDSVVEFALPDVGEPQRPMGLAVTADGSEVWVACHDSDRVHVLDASDGSVLATHVMHPGSGPISVAIDAAGNHALVALHRKGEVAVFDVATRSLVTVIEGLFRRPWGIAFASTGDAYVTHTITEGEDSHVSILDMSALNLAAQVILKSVNPKSPDQIQGDPDPIPEGGYLLLRGHLAQLPGSDRMWLPVQYQNFHNPVFTPESSVQTAIHRIDVDDGTTNSQDKVVLSAVYAHLNTTLLGDGWNAAVSGPVDLGFSADGSTAYLVCAQSNDLLVLPTDITLEWPPGPPPLPEIPVGDQPLGVAISPTVNRAYVMNSLSRDVSVIDLGSLTEINRVPVTPASPEPLPAGFLQGAKLFHASDDPRISANGKMACASCHPNAESDGLLWSFAPLGAGQRDTFSLRGLALSFGPQVGGLGQLHRSGDRDEVQDFELTFRGPNMGGAGFLPAPNPALGAPNAGIDADLDAIATYLLGLPPLERSPHRASDGSLTAAAVRGATIFKNTSGGPHDVGCIGCHPPPVYTDLDFHDVGGFAPPPENEGPAFNTPTLVGVFDGAPFVQVTGWQDGQTIGGVLRNASGGHGDTTGLTARQLRDLEEFVVSIDGDLVASGIAGLLDVEPPRVEAVLPVSLDAVEVIFDETVDPATAGDPSSYVFTDGDDLLLATGAVVDTSRGNRVRVNVALEYPGCDVTYTLLPGPIQDVAAAIQGGVNNVLDVSDPGNQKSFTLDGTITVTFGDTGNETFAGVGRDASFNPGLGNVSHWAWRLYPFTSPEMKGFVAFDFVATLAGECGVTTSTELIDVRFTALPHYGHRNTLELHRCLMPWGEPPNDWCFGCAGSVTRTHATWNSIPWHQSGAGAYGGSGTTLSEYYPAGNFDVAATVDGTAVVNAINERVEFAGPLVTDAFRFWFDNPSVNYGYMVEVQGDQGVGTEFNANDAEAGREGLVLSVTFAIPTTTMVPDCNGNGVADECDIANGSSADQNGNGIPDECEGPDSDFSRGDCNADGGYTISDPIELLGYLFVAGAGTPSCLDACDVDDAAALGLPDAIYSLTALFAGGALPLPPYPGCGADPTMDGLGCATYGPCP